jgi:hypothetical protein
MIIIVGLHLTSLGQQIKVVVQKTEMLGKMPTILLKP